MTPHDLAPAADTLADLVAGISDEQLTAPTPCPLYTLGDLLDHVDGLPLAFTLAARKEPIDPANAAPSGDATRLGDDWRTRIPERLVALSEAWQEPVAWTGMTSVGGIALPGEMAGASALDWCCTAGTSPGGAGSRTTSTRTPSPEHAPSSRSSPSRAPRRCAARSSRRWCPSRTTRRRWTGCSDSAGATRTGPDPPTGQICSA